MSKRDDSIDILRFIAILGIIIIHCDPHCFFVRQLRNFDVPLMVFLAGVSYSITSKSRKVSYGEYIWKRFKRMILPTWIFLSLMTIVTFISTNSLPDTEWLVATYTLTTKSWYVWIIRVLFMMAVAAPLVIPYIDRNFSVQKFLIIGGLLLLVIELMPRSLDRLPLYYLLEFIPFFLIFAFGCEIQHFHKRHLLSMGSVLFIVYVIIAIVLYTKQSQLVNTQIDKYPPPYLLYFVLFILYHCFVCIQRQNCCILR